MIELVHPLPPVVVQFGEGKIYVRSDLDERGYFIQLSHRKGKPEDVGKGIPEGEEMEPPFVELRFKEKADLKVIFGMLKRMIRHAELGTVGTWTAVYAPPTP